MQWVKKTKNEASRFMEKAQFRVCNWPIHRGGVQTFSRLIGRLQSMWPMGAQVFFTGYCE